MAGNYTCVAANDYGSDQRQFTLQILGKGASCESAASLKEVIQTLSFL